MTDITHALGTLYHPQKAFLIYRQNSTSRQVYIESYDIGEDGAPMNAHPLSLTEASALAKALRTTEKTEKEFLKAKGLMPKNLLYLSTGKTPYAVWHTPASYVNLLFREDLGIPSDSCAVPALIWKATRRNVAVYAITGTDEINLDTPLFHAPFFNTYEDGNVCMGNVSLQIPADCALEDFIGTWQQAFYNSYFSHMVQNHNPVKGNMVQLWKRLSSTGAAFPEENLIPMKRTIKNLIS